MDTVWILGDQLNRGIASLQGRTPRDTRVLLVENAAVLAARRWHRQRIHLVLTAMRRFARELEREGFEVDYRVARSFADGLRAHRADHAPTRVLAMEPSSYDLRASLERLGVELVRSNRFLCHYAEFASWAQGRRRLRLEDFYRWQRRRLGILVDGDEPVGGRWNYDTENREPPPLAEGRAWPAPVRSRLDELDRAVLHDLPSNVFGTPPDGLWATSRRAALARLRRFVDDILPRFGPHQDAMLEPDWHLFHSLLGHALNLGLLHPLEVCEAAEQAYRQGRADRVGRGLRPSGARLARVRLGRVLAGDARVPGRTPSGPPARSRPSSAGRGRPRCAASRPRSRGSRSARTSTTSSGRWWWETSGFSPASRLSSPPTG